MTGRQHATKKERVQYYSTHLLHAKNTHETFNIPAPQTGIPLGLTQRKKTCATIISFSSFPFHANSAGIRIPDAASETSTFDAASETSTFDAASETSTAIPSELYAYT